MIKVTDFCLLLICLRKFFFKISDDTALFELIQLVPPGTVLYFDKVIDVQTHFKECFLKIPSFPPFQIKNNVEFLVLIHICKMSIDENNVFRKTEINSI